ncbi:diacylglycerol kinase [Strigomonas culicis]|nr:diacylglycerol kinase [Strigomonas culicis]|eukprot:EPY30904.1 diacylglycerol kinase [Strigomonas culicis]
MIVAGGDGTLSFLMDVVKSLLERGAISQPECQIAPFPLGTGNDLSWTLGFGAGFARWLVLGRVRFRSMLKLINGSHAVRLDRWKLSMELGSEGGSVREKVMNNYFSIGFDATCAGKLNRLRHRYPLLFPSRPIVKLWYAVFAAAALFTQRAIGSSIVLHIDGAEVSVPAHAKALVVCNVPYYAGGSALWNANTDKDMYTVPRIDDGKVEVLCLSGVWHLALIRLALCHGTKLGQGHAVTIQAPSNLSCQYDGEFIEDLRTCEAGKEVRFSVSHYSQATICRCEPLHTPYLIYLSVAIGLLCGLIPYLFF